MTSNNHLIITIMAGGLGKRMNSALPKVLHLIKNKPMLALVVEQALLLHPFKILIIVGKYKNIIVETLSKFMDITNIIFVDQPDPQGTGHAIQCCLPFITENINKKSTILILSGDVPLLEFNTLNDFLMDFNVAKIITTDLENPYGYGRIIKDNNIFNKIVEEKDCSIEERKITNVNGGIYAFNATVLCKYLPYLTNNNSQNEYYLTDIIEIIKTREHIPIDTYNISKDKQYQIMGVNTIDQLIELESSVILG
jgi:UDP-N-acetylglucosamine diphosphorylase/glucosamine-1-phosphate N-acetyltransferase